MRTTNIYTIMLILSLTAGLDLRARIESGEATQIISITGKDLPGAFDGVIPEGIDISPDGTQLAVLFEVGENRAGVGVWLGIWQLNQPKLLRSARIDGPFTNGHGLNPQFVRAVRFSPDSGSLAVQSGPRIRVLDARTLDPAFSVDPPVIVPSPPYGAAIRSFDISADAKRLAVLTAGIYEPGDDAQVAVQVFAISTGRKISEWQTRGRSRHISLSPDGTQVALEKEAKTQFLAVFDALSGAMRREFDSGWKMGAGNVAFVGPDRVAAIPQIGADERGRFFGNGLEVFSVASGNLVEKITCAKFGSTASLAAALHESVLATVSAYQSPGEVRSDARARHSKPQLVVFNLNDETCRPVLQSVPHGQFKATLDQYSLRLSSDGSLAGLLEDQAAKVYRIFPGRSSSISGSR